LWRGKKANSLPCIRGERGKKEGKKNECNNRVYKRKKETLTTNRLKKGWERIRILTQGKGRPRKNDGANESGRTALGKGPGRKGCDAFKKDSDAKTLGGGGRRSRRNILGGLAGKLS